MRQTNFKTWQKTDVEYQDQFQSNIQGYNQYKWWGGRWKEEVMDALDSEGLLWLRVLKLYFKYYSTYQTYLLILIESNNDEGPDLAAPNSLKGVSQTISCDI